MKKWRLLILSMVCAIGLLGCSGEINSTGANDAVEKFEEAENAGTVTKEMLSSEMLSSEIVSSEMISSDMLGQGIYEAIKEEWATWNAKDEMQKLLSSHMPGHCYRGFGTWEECEEFLGFSIFNPLESSNWPEKATYVGMPEGYNEAPRFYVSFYGTGEGQVQWIHVESGYRSEEIRIMVNAQVVVDSPAENSAVNEPLITEDSGERYVANTAVLVKDFVTYNIRVIGEPDMQNEVRETLEQVLPYFEEV